MKFHQSTLCLILLVSFLPGSLAKCGDQKNCNACAVNKCSWCTTSNICADSFGGECASSQIAKDPYDCPIPPRNGYGYDERFAKTKALPLMAAAYSNSPQACLTNALGGAQLKRQLTVHCDSSQTDTCSAFTAVSNSDQAIIASFRGTSSKWQLVMEGADSIFKAKKPFVIGGNVDAYFYDAFYSLWNAGMRDDLLTLKAAHPSYQLWVTGHSLGGSMASLCTALAIKLNMWPADKVKLVTFGQPRTGDINYAKAHDSLLYYGYRVVHAHDLVPHIPPKIFDNWFDSPYHHRYEVWYNNGMTAGSPYQFCSRADDDTCSNTQPHTSISDHLHYFNIDISAYGIAGCR